MNIHKLARYFALGNFAFAAAILLSMAILLNSPETSFAQTTANSTSQTTQSASCVPPSFYSFNVTPVYLNTPWSLPLLSTIDGPFVATVTAKGLPQGVELQDQKTTLEAGGSVLHLWVLSGAPSQVGTYTITVTAQNACGGTSSVITLPVNNSTAAPAANTSVSVAFDKESLVVSTSTPTVTGTSNTSKVSLAIKNSIGNVYTSPLYSVLNGRWSIPLSNISTGTYSLSLYGENNLLLILGTLIAAVPTSNSAPSATVPTTLTPTTTIQAQSVSTGACVQLPAATMQIGGRGTGVENLQNFLIQMGFLAPGSATGYFGPLTRSAVQKFQASAGIVSSGDEATTGFGLVGGRTKAAMTAGCGGQNSSTSGNTGSTQTYSTTTTLPKCPIVPRPVCTNGTLISLGTDENRCSLGSVCQTTQSNINRPEGYVCPIVNNPSCQYGTLVSLGTDYYGCSLGSYCQPVNCSAIQQITSCPAGQTLVSGTDKYGCPNISYCSGTPSGTSPPTLNGPGSCPVVDYAACPAGQHYETLYSYTDLGGCVKEYKVCTGS